MQHIATLDLPVTALRTYPGNARRSDVGAIADSLAANGQYRAVVVRADNPDEPKTGGVILTGNHTFIAATEKLDWPMLRCELIDCTDTEARRIVLVDNRLADKAKYDHDALVELLGAAVDGDGGLSGTGWEKAEYDKLVGVLPLPGDADTDDELDSLYGVSIECDTEEQQGELLERFSAEGLRVRALMR